MINVKYLWIRCRCHRVCDYQIFAFECGHSCVKTYAMMHVIACATTKLRLKRNWFRLVEELLWINKKKFTVAGRNVSICVAILFLQWVLIIRRTITSKSKWVVWPGVLRWKRRAEDIHHFWLIYNCFDRNDEPAGSAPTTAFIAWMAFILKDFILFISLE